MGWEELLIAIATNISVTAGLFLWLRNDIKQLDGKMVDGFQAVDDRLRAVEQEQARIAGLLQGLGLTGKLPSGDSS